MENIIFILDKQVVYLGEYERCLILRGKKGETYLEPDLKYIEKHRLGCPFKSQLPKEVILEKYNV